MAEMYSPESEQALLSDIIYHPEDIDAISEILEPDEFYELRHQLIYSTAVGLRMTGQKVDPIQIAQALKIEGKLDQAGGLSYFRELLDPNSVVAFGTDPLALALNVKDASQRRLLKDAAEKMLADAQYGSGMTGLQAIEGGEAAIQEIQSGSQSSGEVVAISDLYEGALEAFEAARDMPEGVETGINTGFFDLDEMLGGLKGTRMYIIAARPGSGKTTIALDIARAAAFLQAQTVLFFSLEMTQSEIMEKLISAEALVELRKLQKGDLTEDEWFRIREVRGRLKESNFLVDTSPNVGLPKIRTLAMRQKARPAGLDMILIDYLQLMEVPAGPNKNTNREQQVSALSRGLKLLAKELDVPVIVLAQLNRGPENRADLTPKVSDLRESGSLEQDADAVILINRPEIADAMARPGEADVIVGKNRHGKMGKVKLTSMLEFSKFVNAAGEVSREPSVLEDGSERSIIEAGDDEVPF